jgi:hypothetical protein
MERIVIYRETRPSPKGRIKIKITIGYTGRMGDKTKTT